MTNKMMCVTEHAKEFINKLCLFKISCPEKFNLQRETDLLYLPGTPGIRQIQNATHQVVK